MKLNWHITLSVACVRYLSKLIKMIAVTVELSLRNLSETKDEEVVVMLWDHDEEQSARAAVKELSKIKSVGGLGR